MMKIKTITLCNFRAFPGPEPQTFELDGKNLLVYGENGSGKSSLFYALKTFFSSSPSDTGLETCNVFAKSTDTWDASEHWIEVAFDDNASSVRWTGPSSGSEWPNDARVEEATRIRGCLDYRALLDTNYRHFGSEINLFEIAVERLLADFQLLGAPPNLASLWANVLKTTPETNRLQSTLFLGANSALSLQIEQEKELLMNEVPIETLENIKRTDLARIVPIVKSFCAI